MGQVVNLRTDCQSVQPGASPAVGRQTRNPAQPKYHDRGRSESRHGTNERVLHVKLQHQARRFLDEANSPRISENPLKDYLAPSIWCLEDLLDRSPPPRNREENAPHTKRMVFPEHTTMINRWGLDRLAAIMSRIICPITVTLGTERISL